ncbi:MAG: SDR family oxidoreductase [Anaerolineae bacterium]|nr:SDR family oxidoreductase [Anaerolineae bacterium]
MLSTILVTGATGNIGLDVYNQLNIMGLSPVAAVRNPDKAREILGTEAQLLPFDFKNPATYAPALKGIKKLFLMRPPDIADVKTYVRPVIQAAKDAGVEHVVFLSLLGAENNPIVPHYTIEKDLMASGMAWTFLRASFFMQNLSTTHLAEIRDEDSLMMAAGHGKTSFIDGRDIVAVAAMALTESGHENKGYPLTGSEALDYFTVADMLTEVLGRKITYRNPSIIVFARQMKAQGNPWAYILVTSALYTTARLGMAAKITNETERLLGRPPIQMRRYIEDYKQTWMPKI